MHPNEMGDKDCVGWLAEGTVSFLHVLLYILQKHFEF